MGHTHIITWEDDCLFVFVILECCKMSINIWESTICCQFNFFYQNEKLLRDFLVKNELIGPSGNSSFLKERV